MVPVRASDSILEIENETLDHITYVRYACMHCDDPPCVESCPEGAISKRPDGIVLIDQGKCKAHRECVKACPYGVIEINPDQDYFPGKKEENKGTAPAHQNHMPGKASKCTLCAHRIDMGKEPACVAGCPSKAMIFGDLDDSDSPIREKLWKSEELLPEEHAHPKVFYVIPKNFLNPLEERVKQNPKMMRG
jgi:Fe-S-cluster-containing dehydrogenase component